MKLTAKNRYLAGISLVEVMIACGLFGIAAASAIGALIRMNHNASLSRLQTGASTVAQNRIDQFLGDRPFKVKEGQYAPSLALGTVNTGSEAAPQVPIYTDPVTGQASVVGWMTSTVTDAGFGLNGTALHVRSIVVTVSYKYRSKNYSVTMRSARSPE